MSNLSVYQVLAEAFRRERVRTCFALLGDANMNWAAALASRECEFVYVRHEHCAISAAMSWARATGETGVASVTCGPGVTQTLTALPAAVRARIPLVIMAGEAPLKKRWYNQAIEQGPLVVATGAAYVPLHHVGSIPVQVRDAFLQAQRELRPVVLGAPLDLQDEQWPGTVSWPAPAYRIRPEVGPAPPHPDDIERVLSVIRPARRVVIIAGLGAARSDAASACQALAQRVGGLLATTLPARGLFAGDEFSLGIAGGFASDLARELLPQADLVIAVGMSLAHHNADGGTLFSADKVLHIDIEPLAVSQGRVAATHHLRADARLGVEALLQSLDADSAPPPAWLPGWRRSELAQLIQQRPADEEVFAIEPGLHDPREVVGALDSALPPDWELVNSSGHCSYYFSNMPSRPAQRFHTIREFGAIGNGISYAIGVALARPQTPVVLFDGDGSLLMHIQELETIRRHKLNILVCVMNDGAYGSEIHKLRAEGLPDDGAVFGRPDFAGIAAGFGVAGALISNLSTLDAAVVKFSATGGSAVWDFPVSDKVVSPVVRRSHPSHS